MSNDSHLRKCSRGRKEYLHMLLERYRIQLLAWRIAVMMTQGGLLATV